MPMNQCLTETPEDENHDLRHAADCLVAYLNTHGKSNQFYAVLRFLAEETQRQLDAERPAHFNYFAIRHAVTGESEGDHSAWFTRHWKMLNGDFRQRCEEGLQAFAAAQGLSVYPWVEKIESDGGAGNQALITLVARPLPEDHAPKANHLRLPQDIVYIPAEKLELAWWARWLFDEHREARGWRKWLLIWPQLLWLLTMLILLALLALILSVSRNPLTTQDLMLVFLAGGILLLCRNVARRFGHFVDDRIILAAESMVGFKEFGVCLELFKPENAPADAPSCARMVKYAAQCPICSAQVLLESGTPDFPRRLVGRCRESPREHVFSFDRVTRTGRYLL